MKALYEIALDEGWVPVEIERGEGDILKVTLAGVSYEVAARDEADGLLHLLIGGRSCEASVRLGESVSVDLAGHAYHYKVRDERERMFEMLGGAIREAGPAQLVCPMPGRVVQVLVQDGDLVEAGKPLVIIEAMKMENALAAPRSGVVAKLSVKAGMGVEGGHLLLVIGDAEPT